MRAAIERTEGKIVVLKQREQDLWEELRRNEQELRMAQSGRDEEQMGLDHSRTRLPELEQQRQLRQGLAEQEARKLMEDVKATAQTLLMKPDKLLVALQRLQEEAKKS